MRPTLIITITFYFLSAFVFSQTILTKNLNSFRPGDQLIKQQVEFKNPGRTGIDVIWDFSNLKSIEKNYSVYYFEPNKNKNDSIFVTNVESRTMYKYVYKGDSMLYLGFENSGSQLRLDNVEYRMKYPFKMGDSISCSYNGSGRYQFALLTEVNGKMHTKADAIGTLILPNGDTISNVIRLMTEQVFTQKTLPTTYEKEKSFTNVDSVPVFNSLDLNRISTDTLSLGLGNIMNVSNVEKEQKKLKSTTKKQLLKQKTDSIYFRTQTCRWYAPGYRYPIFETICNYSKALPEDTIEMDDMATAFYFPPSKHLYLENDPENKAILDSLKISKKENLNKTDSLLFDYNYFPNPVRNDITIELLLKQSSVVTFRIYNSSGNIVLVSQEGTHPSGIRRFSLKTNKLRFGEYVLHIEVNNQTAYALLLKI